MSTRTFVSAAALFLCAVGSSGESVEPLQATRNPGYNWQGERLLVMLYVEPGVSVPPTGPLLDEAIAPSLCAVLERDLKEVGFPVDYVLRQWVPNPATGGFYTEERGSGTLRNCEAHWKGGGTPA